MKLEVKQLPAKYKTPSDDIMYSRDDFGVPKEGEVQQVLDAINLLGLQSADAEAAFRYYHERGYKGSLIRRYESLSVAERVELFNKLSPEANTYLTGYLNGGAAFDELVNEGVGVGAGPSLLGG